MSRIKRIDVTRFWALQGFSVMGTGGGCEALHKQIGDDGSFIYITHQDDPSIPDALDSPVDIGWYDAEGDMKSYTQAANSAAAIVAIAAHEVKR